MTLSLYDKAKTDELLALKTSEAPIDGVTYGRKDGAWISVTTPANAANQLTAGVITTNPTSGPSTAGDVLQYNGTALVWGAASGGSYLTIANNLSELTATASTARTNLGLGTMATQTATNYLDKAGNLSGLASTSTARTNLGLGTAAVEPASKLVPSGGTTGQVLAKASATSWDLVWSTPGGGGGGGINVQSFGSPTSSGTFTWTKPTGAKWVEVLLVGPGGAGGSGARLATTSARSGGGGGSGGSIFYGRINADFLGATETVIVGAGQPGGAAVTTDTTTGNSGTNGVNTRFSIFISGFGNAGSGGTTASGFSGTVRSSNSFSTLFNSGGGAAGATTSGGSATNQQIISIIPQGGGGGAGAAANNTTAAAGGSGGAILTGSSSAGLLTSIAGGAGGTTAGVAATNGTSHTTQYVLGGTGGGGGAYRTGQPGGAGGNGGWPRLSLIHI